MDITDAKIGAEPAEEFGSVAETAVAHDAFSRNSEVRVVGERKLEKGDRASSSLIKHPGREGNAEMVFIADIQVFPSAFLALMHTHAASGDPMAGSGEVTHVLHASVIEHFRRAYCAPSGAVAGEGIDTPDSVQPHATESPADGEDGNAKFSDNPLASIR